jgi:hypothetical protein
LKVDDYIEFVDNIDASSLNNFNNRYPEIRTNMFIDYYFTGEVYIINCEIDVLNDDPYIKIIEDGYLQFTKADGVAEWVSDSNDIEMNKLENLPLGESTIKIVVPKRTLAPGSYSIYLNFASRQNIMGVYVDSPLDVCVFSLTDDHTRRGDSRAGYLSTLLDWNIL